MTAFTSSRLSRKIGNFYLRSSARVSVGVTTAVVVFAVLTTVTALQLILGPRFDRGFWLGIALSVAMPLLITPPITGMIVKLVHQLKHANELAYDLANVDELTRFKTRRRFLVEATAEIERATLLNEPLVLLMIDVDQFKEVNDQFGHLTGDRVLIEVAGACRKALRSSDIMARLGGDEMAFLLPATDLRCATKLAEKVRAAIAHLSITNRVPERGSNTPVTVAVTVSIGGAPFHPGESLDELFMYADQALYRAKANGRNQVRLSETPGTNEVPVSL